MLFLHELRTEQRLFWRNREAAFFTFLLPIVFFLIFGSIYGNDIIKGENVRAKAFLEAGMIGYGVASTAFAGLAITMVIRRESGVLKRIPPHRCPRPRISAPCSGRRSSSS
jgi:ABC-2 type transport system permease protein